MDPVNNCTSVCQCQGHVIGDDQVVCDHVNCVDQCGSSQFVDVRNDFNCIVNCTCENPPPTTATEVKRVTCQDINCSIQCGELGFVEERDADGCVVACSCYSCVDCKVRCGEQNFKEVRNPITNCVSECVCECPPVLCVAVCDGNTLVERRDPVSNCITGCECQVTCPDINCSRQCRTLHFVEVKDGNDCVVNCICEPVPPPSPSPESRTTTESLIACQDASCFTQCEGLEFTEERDVNGCVVGCYMLSLFKV